LPFFKQRINDSDKVNRLFNKIKLNHINHFIQKTNKCPVYFEIKCSIKYLFERNFFKVFKEFSLSL
jgi:hypothetical protein